MQIVFRFRLPASFIAPLFFLLTIVTPSGAEPRPRIELVPQLTVHHWWSAGAGNRALSPDGALVVTPGGNTAKLWDVASGKLIRVFQGHAKSVSAVTFSPGGRFVLSGSQDETLKLWETSTGRLIRTFEGPIGWVHAVAFSVNGRTVLGAGHGKAIALWETDTGSLMRTLPQDHSVNTAIFSPDGKFIASGHGNDGHGSLKLWDAATGSLIRTFAGSHEMDVTSLSFSPDGTRLISTSLDGTLKLWEPASGRLIRSNGGPHYNAALYTGTFSPDGKRILSQGSRNDLSIFNGHTGKHISDTPTHDNGIIAFASHGPRILSLYWIEDAKTGKLVGKPPVRLTGAASAAFSPDGTQIVLTNLTYKDGSYAGHMRVWDLAAASLETRLVADGAFSLAPIRKDGADGKPFLLSQDGRKALSRRQDNTLDIWNTETGALVRRLGHAPGLVAMSRDGGLIAVEHYDRSIEIWDTAAGRLVRTIETHNHNEIRALAISPDGSQLFAAFRKHFDFSLDASPICDPFGPDGEDYSQPPDNRLWDMATGKLLYASSPRCAEPFCSSPRSALFSPDGSRILLPGFDGAELLETASGKLVRTLGSPGAPITAAAFSVDGTQVLVGTSEHVAQLWDVATGTLLRTFSGHLDDITSVAFSPNGSRVITTSNDGTMRVWDAATGKEWVKLLVSASGDWLAVTPAGFFDTSSNGIEMLAAVRGVEVLPVKPLRAPLQRKDLIRALFYGNAREYEAAAAALDLEKAAAGHGQAQPIRPH
jgi:WD40 repeat protein